MPNTPRDNIEKWDKLSEIYYYSYFITTWISFNAWYNFSFPHLQGDRTVINHIKNHSSPAKTRLLSLLRGTNQESIQFRENIAQLHYTLQNHNVSTEEQRIWFSSFIVELDRTCFPITEKAMGITYHVNITIANGEVTNVLATIKNYAGKTILNYSHSKIEIEHLRLNADYQSLSQAQKSQIEGFVNQANPRKAITLLTVDPPPNCIECGQFKLIKDENIIFKAVIEMLYALRNKLFHGDLTPSPEANKVYEAAYRILKQIVEGIK